MSWDGFPQRVKAHIVTRVGPIKGSEIFNAIDADTMRGYYESDLYSNSDEVAEAIVNAYLDNDPNYQKQKRQEEKESREALALIEKEKKEKSALQSDVIQRLERIKSACPDMAIMNGQWAEDVEFLADCLLDGKGKEYLDIRYVPDPLPEEKEKSRSSSVPLMVSNILLIAAIIAFFIFK